MTKLETRPTNLRILADRTADGHVDGPASEIDPTASYTFEAEIDGRWYRWIDQRPTIVGDRAHFHLRGGTPIATPT